MGTAQGVKEFYEEFAARKLLTYFESRNRRLDAARQLVERFTPRGLRILEVGCGVGILTRHLERRATRLLAIDISETNIQIARAYLGEKSRAELRVLDILASDWEASGSEEFDVIVLVDVVEHIPKPRQAELFATLEAFLAEDGVILLTFPSPEYQEFLKRHDPGALQVIDETVTIRELLDATRLTPVYMSYAHVWSRNQYIHLVLADGPRVSAEPIHANAFRRAAEQVNGLLWRWSNRALLRRFRPKV